jgi:hypothetical protein
MIVHRQYGNAARTLCGLEVVPGVEVSVGHNVTCAGCLHRATELVEAVPAAAAPVEIRRRINASGARFRSEARQFKPKPPERCTAAACSLQHCGCGTHDFENVRHTCT